MKGAWLWRRSFDRRTDARLDHCRVADEHLVRDANDLDSALTQCERPFVVVLCHQELVVLPAIDFDRQFQLRAVKVENVAADWILAAELVSVETTITEPRP